MEFFFLLLNIFIFTILINISGIQLNKTIFKNYDLNIYENGIINSIFISILALNLNFFLPLNNFINHIFLFSLLVFSVHSILKNKIIIKKILFKIFIVSFLSFLFICLSNVNRPDAGLYHLPFINILNENKILVGSGNIHFRFSHISITQYFSAIFNNSIFGDKSISVPIVVLMSNFICLFFSKSNKILKKNEIYFKDILTLLIFIISLINFNRFSDIGNDGIAHLYFFYLTYLLFNFSKKNDIKLIKLSIVSLVVTYLFLNKIFYAFSFLIPFYVLINEKNYIWLKSKFFFFLSLTLSTYLLRNFLVSGCFIFPLKFSCLEVDWFDKDTIYQESISGKAWSKNWNSYEGPLSMSKFSENFNWLSTWLSGQFHYISEKIILNISILVIFLILLVFTKKIEIDKKSIKYFLAFYFFLIINIIFWFLNFPIYRYGEGYILIFLIFSILFIVFFTNLKPILPKKYLTIFFSILILVIFSKNILRIFDNFDANKYHPWPKIYPEQTKKKDYKKVFDKYGNFLFYQSKNQECMYFKSPCTYYINQKIYLKKNMFYKFYNVNE